MDMLIHWDAMLFRLINEGMSNVLFDALLPWCREKWFWAPLYLFIAVFSWANFGRRGWLVVLGMLLCVALSDVSSSRLIKKNVRRIRPCNTPEMAAHLHLRTDCGSGYSFTSSHAANHFAIAVFLMGVLGPLPRWARHALLWWAGSIAFSQVYVGVHYPGDVVCGALLGSTIGWWLAFVYKIRGWTAATGA